MKSSSEKFELKSGSIVALVTPFLENGSVDNESLKSLIDWHVACKTSGIVICGSTGEAATLSDDEYYKLIEFSVTYAQSRIQIIAGVGTNSTISSIEKVEKVSKLGIDALLVVVPYYNKPSQEGMYQHFSAIAKSTDLPIVLYNVPSRTVASMSAETVIRLATNFRNIVGVKEASGCMTTHGDIIASKPNGFKVYSGDDLIAFSTVALGGDGCISVIANVIPNEFSDLMTHLLKADLSSARDYYFRYKELMKISNLETNPIPIKTALAVMGKIKDVFRLPLTNMETENREVLLVEMKKLELL